VGNLSELGEWNPKLAINLLADSSSHWVVTVSLPCYSRIYYKYLYKNQNGDTKLEPFEQNRVLYVNNPKHQIDDGQFGVQPDSMLPLTRNKQGFRNGVEIVYYPSKEKQFQLTWKDGILEGEEKGWHPNGQLQFDRFRVNGKIEGEEKRWHDNGQLSSFWVWKNQMVIGDDTGWHPNGQLAHHRFYSEGMKQEGEENQWHQNGQLSVKRHWNVGFEEKREQKFLPDGTLVYDVAWEHGWKMEERKYDNDGHLIYECEWYPKGGIKFEHKY